MERTRDTDSLVRQNAVPVAYQRLNSRQRYITPGLICLMLAIALERITFYIVTTNMTHFFSVAVNTSSYVSVTTYLVFTGTTDFLPLIGGMLGDSMISRYACTLIGFLIEAVGSIFLLILMVIKDTLPFTPQTSADFGLVFTGLTLMAIGLGFHRSNILTVGLTQVCQDQDQKENIKSVEKFFRGYYWISNIGSLIAFIVISVSVGTDSQPKTKYYLGIIQTITVVTGAFFIIVGKRWYIRTTPESEGLRKLTRSFFRKFKMFINFFRQKTNHSFTPTSSKQLEQHSEDEILTQIFRIILVTSSLIMFQIIFSLEFGPIFYLQGKAMDYRIHGWPIPVQIMKSFDAITIILVLPIIHFLITPFLQRKNKNMSLLKRMGFGLMFGCVSALTCGVVETVRQHFLRCSEDCFSIFLQVPQFVFLSLGEIFVIVTSYQFMYLESPPNLQGLVLGIEFCLRALGSYIAQILLVIVQAKEPKWYPMPDNFKNDDGHVEYFMYILAGLQLLFFPIFLWQASNYRYKYVNQEPDRNSERTPLCRSPIQSEMFNSCTSLGSASTNSLDSLDSLRSRDRN